MPGALLALCLAASVFAQRTVVPLPMPVSPLPAGSDAVRVKAFVDAFHKDLIVQNPVLFKQKLAKAAESDFNFYRAFPQLQYAELRQSPHAAALAASVTGRAAGDAHPDNVELVDFDGRKVAQVNDFDDSGIAPLAVDIVRTVAGTWFLTEASDAERRMILEEARKGYRDGLKQDFAKWSESIQSEKSLKEARSRDREWLKHAGTPLSDEPLAERLAKFAGVERKDWKPFDRAGAGLSSIGVRRYMFASDRRSDAYELKQLRASALEYFTGAPQSETDAARVAEGFSKLRKVSAELSTFAFDAADWSTRRREGSHVTLDPKHPKSAARVIGGMLAQMHLAQGLAPARLEEALAAASVRAAEESATAMARFRKELVQLLKDGAWT
ncbi:MAG: DUF2252 family protein [Elusimicrobia bacterium]|nr:DUF2252 family protein [Elusimicrobiota bacterium]